MMVGVCEPGEVIGNVRAQVSSHGRIPGKGGGGYGVFDSYHNIAQVLKFLPFYERLGLRVLNSRWNLSFGLAQCWESLDLRFLDLGRSLFFRRNLGRFSRSATRLDVSVDQLYQFSRLLGSPLCTNSKCAGPKDLSEPLSARDPDSESLCSADTDDGCNSGPCDSLIQAHSLSSSTKLTSSTVSDLQSILCLCRNLRHLHISSTWSQDRSVSTRVNPVLAKFVESQPYSHPSTPGYSPRIGHNLALNGPELSHFSQIAPLETLVIDAPISIDLLLDLIPFLKNVRNLVISRIMDHESICMVLAELLEHIPRNQLRSLQIGRTISFKRISPPDLSAEAKIRRAERISSAYKMFGSGELDEGDEVVALLLSNHPDSLEILVVDDVNISNTAYNAILKLRNLRYSKIYVWSSMEAVLPGLRLL